jgi:hypothetical protein
MMTDEQIENWLLVLRARVPIEEQYAEQLKAWAREFAAFAIAKAREEGRRSGIEQAAEFCDRMAGSGLRGTLIDIAEFIRELPYPDNTPLTTANDGEKTMNVDGTADTKNSIESLLNSIDKYLDDVEHGRRGHYEDGATYARADLAVLRQLLNKASYPGNTPATDG